MEYQPIRDQRLDENSALAEAYERENQKRERIRDILRLALLRGWTQEQLDEVMGTNRLTTALEEMSWFFGRMATVAAVALLIMVVIGLTLVGWLFWKHSNFAFYLGFMLGVALAFMVAMSKSEASLREARDRDLGEGVGEAENE